MEMGDNPSSGAGQAFSNCYDERLADTFDEISDSILRTEPQALQDEVARVRARHGYAAGRLFHISTFTDDQCSYVVSSDVGCTTGGGVSSRMRLRRPSASAFAWHRQSSSSLGRWCTRSALVTCSQPGSHT